MKHGENPHFSLEPVVQPWTREDAHRKGDQESGTGSAPGLRETSERSLKASERLQSSISSFAEKKYGHLHYKDRKRMPNAAQGGDAAKDQ